MTHPKEAVEAVARALAGKFGGASYTVSQTNWDGYATALLDRIAPMLIAAEREACAKVAEMLHETAWPDTIAAAIRAREVAATARGDAQAQLLRDAEAKIANQKLEISNLKASMQGKPKRGPDRPTDGNSALRRAGYVTIPRWWVTQDQLEVIERIANSNRDEVWRIKNGEP